MTFNVGIGSTLIASYTDYGIPYLWKSGDITTTPSNETKITDDGTQSGTEFGVSVAVGSCRIVVGAWRSDVGSNTDQGSAYIFNLDGNQLGIITASNGAAYDFFGHSVAVGDGRIVVGAYGNDDNGSFSGSAYIFDLDGNQLGIITASDAAGGDHFGYSVAVGCGRIVVGARYNDVGSNSNQGSAYIFDLDGNQLGIITASNGAASDYFGYSVAVGSGRIVVGAPYDDVGPKVNQGSAYIFNLNGNQLGIITASDGAAYDNFGWSVAVGSGRIVVGAPYDDNTLYAINDHGSIYIFDLNGNQLEKIISPNGVAGDLFGDAVAVGSGRIVVGARGVDVGSNTDQGSAYIFDLDGNQLEIITASDPTAGDLFGESVAVGSGRIVVGTASSAYIYETPQVYTLYDAIDMQSVGITTL